MLIREAHIEDAPVLFAAEKETATSPGLLASRPEELRLGDFAKKIAELSQNGRYIVAEENGKVIGHAFLDPMPLQALSHVFRLTIIVHPGFHSRGIGNALMKELMNWAKQAPSLRKIELLVRASNERAIRLYAKLGFVEEGRFKDRVRLPDGSFGDDIAMAWFPERGP